MSTVSFVLAKISAFFSFIKRRWLLSSIILIVLIGGAFFWYRRQQANQPQLTFQKPVMEQLTKTLEVSGVVDAKEKARLRYLAGGKLTYLGAQEGDEVTKWQTLAVIDQATLKKQLEQDLNLFMKERLDWDQLNEDVFFNEYTTTEERDIEKGQLDLDNEVLDVEIRDIAINNTRLYAPFDGILTVSPSTTTGIQLLSTDYFEIVNPETMLFRAEVDEADIALVKEGQRASIILDSYLDTDVETYVDSISFTSSQTSNGTVFFVEMPLNSLMYGKKFFRIGMNGNVAIELETRMETMTIPLIATIQRDDEMFVEVKIDENTTEERKIEVGLETDEKIEVISGLSLDDEIVIPE